MYVIFASYGNDSVALIQHIHECKFNDQITVLYSDTGWAAEWWDERVRKGEDLAQSYGFQTVRTKSAGMESLVKSKQAWPMGGGAAFCTAELKVKPALEWLEVVDPHGDATCVTGVRREESRNRASAPEWIESSERHGGRELWQPLVRFDSYDRDALLDRAGFPVLPHRSVMFRPARHKGAVGIRAVHEWAMKPRPRDLRDADTPGSFCHSGFCGD